MKYAVRQATGLDISQIIALCVELAKFEGRFIHKESSREEISTRVTNEILHDKSCAYFVAEDGSKIIGVLKVAHKESGMAKISEAFVLDKYRRMGVMHALFEHAVEWAVSRGLKSIYLTVVNGNDLAYNYWKSMGFEFDSYVGDTLIKMHKDIDNKYAG